MQPAIPPPPGGLGGSAGSLEKLQVTCDCSPVNLFDVWGYAQRCVPKMIYMWTWWNADDLHQHQTVQQRIVIWSGETRFGETG